MIGPKHTLKSVMKDLEKGLRSGEIKLRDEPGRVPGEAGPPGPTAAPRLSELRKLSSRELVALVGSGLTLDALRALHEIARERLSRGGDPLAAELSRLTQSAFQQ